MISKVNYSSNSHARKVSMIVSKSTGVKKLFSSWQRCRDYVRRDSKTQWEEDSGYKIRRSIEDAGWWQVERFKQVIWVVRRMILTLVGTDIPSLASAVELDTYLGSCPYVLFGQRVRFRYSPLRGIAFEGPRNGVLQNFSYIKGLT